MAATTAQQHQQQMLTAGLRYLAAGLSLVPINPATKKPWEEILPTNRDTSYGGWKMLQERQPTEEELRYWIACGAQLALVCGAISGNILLFDFDQPGFYPAWLVAVGPLADGLVQQRTGSGKRHVICRCPQPGKNDKLAFIKEDSALDGRAIAIETRAEAGYALIAPSMHASGKQYEIISGDLTAIPEISQAHAEALLAAARTLNEASLTRQQEAAMQAAMSQQSQTRQALNGSGSVIDAYNQSTTIEDELRSQGYRQQGQRWLPPGAKNGDSSVTVQAGKCFHHDSNFPLSDGHWHDAFDLYIFWRHNGDRQAAVKMAATLLGLSAPPRHTPSPAAPGQPQPSATAPASSTPPTPGHTPRLAITIDDLDLPHIVQQAWSALLTANQLSAAPVLYRRGTGLARIETDDAGRAVLTAVNKIRLRGILSRACTFEQTSRRKTTLVSPPDVISDDMLINPNPAIPIIHRVTPTPVFASDGSIRLTPGYDPAAQAFYAPAKGFTMPDVPDQPTRAEMLAALALICDELLGDFPFAEPADKTNALALLLMPFVREMIDGSTPLHLIEAPTMGSGKGLLTDALLWPALGQAPTPQAEAGDDDEWRKRITSALLGGPSVIFFDNLNHTLASGALAAALTTPEWTDRLLGQSEMVRIPIKCAWVATANNPMLSTEIARRCIRIRIDPKIDKPWERRGFKHPQLRVWIRSNHARLVWAALVLVRYGLQHGTPGRDLGSYESWALVMGTILNGIEIPDFLGNLDALYDRADQTTAAWRELATEWWDQYGAQDVLAGDLLSIVVSNDIELGLRSKSEHGRKSEFGRAITKMEDRVLTLDIAGQTVHMRIEHGGTSHNAKLWRLNPQGQAPAPATPAGPASGGATPAGDMARDLALESQALAEAAAGSYDRAHQTASGMRGRKERDRVRAEISLLENNGGTR